MLIRRPLLPILLLAPLLLFAVPTTQSHAQDADEVSKTAPQQDLLPTIEEETQGSCLTPRQSYLQVIYWAKKDANKAALCFDTSSLDEPASQAPDLAKRMLEFLDADDRYIKTDKAPTANDYTDPRSGKHEYYDPIAPDFRIRRVNDGRWLFTPESLSKIPESSSLKNLNKRPSTLQSEQHPPAQNTGSVPSSVPSSGTGEEKRILPPVEDEVQGSCLTPRQSYLQVLYWAKKDANKAALCFDTSRLDEPASQAPDLAERMLEFLDSDDRFIETDKTPTTNNYTDPRSGKHEYYDPIAPEFRIRRVDDGRWLFTPESLSRIPESSFIKSLANKLPGWFQSKFAGNEVWKYIGIIALFFIALVIQRTVLFIIRTYLVRLVNKAKLNYLDRALERADRPIGGLVMAAIFNVGIPMLAFSLKVAHIGAVATKALAVYSIVWLGYRLIDVLGLWMESKAEGTETKLDDQLVPLIIKTLKVFVAVLGGIFVLQNLEVDVGSLLAGVGLGGLAFALAAKDTVANFFGSVMIFVDKPFQIGDWIVIEDVEGTVEEVGFRTTRVRTFYNSLVTVPNASITNNNVDNYGMRKYRRYTTKLGLSYDTPAPKVQAFCEAVRAVISGMPGMRRDYYLVEFHGFGASTLNILLYCFMECKDWNEELRIRGHLNLEIMNVAKELGISFAFPTQTLHIDTMASQGGHNPSHRGPSSANELAEIVEGFSQSGKLQNYRGTDIADRYDCGPEWPSERWTEAESSARRRSGSSEE